MSSDDEFMFTASPILAYISHHASQND